MSFACRRSQKRTIRSVASLANRFGRDAGRLRSSSGRRLRWVRVPSSAPFRRIRYPRKAISSKPNGCSVTTSPPVHFTKVVCWLDAAAKTGVRNDYSAIVKLGVTKNAYFVLDVWRGKVEFPALLRRVDALKDEDPAPSTIYVEDTSNATALIQALKSETRMPIVAVPAKGVKKSRVEGVTGILEAKKVFLPKEAPWLLDFERELLAFPAGKHDDQVDAFVGALSQVAPKGSHGFCIAFGDDGIERLDAGGNAYWREFSKQRDAEDAAREAAEGALIPSPVGGGGVGMALSSILKT